MQTQLEKNAIEKRNISDTSNAMLIFGNQKDATNGNTKDSEYDINGSNARKGHESFISVSDHTIRNIDMDNNGGDIIDIEARKKQLTYTIEGVERYTKENQYSSDLIDTSQNVGQVVIY